MLKDIYFYKAMDLARELKNGSVSEARAIKHLIATIIIGGVGFEVPVSVTFSDLPSDYSRFFAYIFTFVVTGIISYYGVWLTYQANSKGDGKDYFLRFVSLTLPIGIQLIVLFLGAGLILAILSYVLIESFGKFGTYLSLLFTYIAVIVFTAMFFLRMHKYIGVASGEDV